MKSSFCALVLLLHQAVALPQAFTFADYVITASGDFYEEVPPAPTATEAASQDTTLENIDGHGVKEALDRGQNEAPEPVDVGHQQAPEPGFIPVYSAAGLFVAELIIGEDILYLAVDTGSFHFWVISSLMPEACGQAIAAGGGCYTAGPSAKNFTSSQNYTFGYKDGTVVFGAAVVEEDIGSAGIFGAVSWSEQIVALPESAKPWPADSGISGVFPLGFNEKAYEAARAADAGYREVANGTESLDELTLDITNWHFFTTYFKPGAQMFLGFDYDPTALYEGDLAEVPVSSINGSWFVQPDASWVAATQAPIVGGAAPTPAPPPAPAPPASTATPAPAPAPTQTVTSTINGAIFVYYIYTIDGVVTTSTATESMTTTATDLSTTSVANITITAPFSNSTTTGGTDTVPTTDMSTTPTDMTSMTDTTESAVSTATETATTTVGPQRFVKRESVPQMPILLDTGSEETHIDTDTVKAIYGALSGSCLTVEGRLHNCTYPCTFNYSTFTIEPEYPATIQLPWGAHPITVDTTQLVSEVYEDCHPENGANVCTSTCRGTIQEQKAGASYYVYGATVFKSSFFKWDTKDNGKVGAAPYTGGAGEAWYYE
ncbi:hypothetical protein TWF696_000511 [Orbilia brochopaga]|uniref:Peptidase A1 domain-containing protein n=1 Tax=Orbilia brochopaga TaxID=3140254 RepID=A0AAV9VHV0_9PEZI